MHDVRTTADMPARKDPYAVSRLGILISWLAVFAILLVVGAGLYLAVQGLLLTRSVPTVLVAAAFAVWVGVLAYRVMRSEVFVKAFAPADATDRPD